MSGYLLTFQLDDSGNIINPNVPNANDQLVYEFDTRRANSMVPPETGYLRMLHLMHSAARPEIDNGSEVFASETHETLFDSIEALIESHPEIRTAFDTYDEDAHRIFEFHGDRQDQILSPGYDLSNAYLNPEDGTIMMHRLWARDDIAVVPGMDSYLDIVTELYNSTAPQELRRIPQFLLDRRSEIEAYAAQNPWIAVHLGIYTPSAPDSPNADAPTDEDVDPDLVAGEDTEVGTPEDDGGDDAFSQFIEEQLAIAEAAEASGDFETAEQAGNMAQVGEFIRGIIPDSATNIVAGYLEPALAAGQATEDFSSLIGEYTPPEGSDDRLGLQHTAWTLLTKGRLEVSSAALSLIGMFLNAFGLGDGSPESGGALLVGFAQNFGLNLVPPNSLSSEFQTSALDTGIMTRMNDPEQFFVYLHNPTVHREVVVMTSQIATNAGFTSDVLNPTFVDENMTTSDYLAGYIAVGATLLHEDDEANDRPTPELERDITALLATHGIAAEESNILAFYAMTQQVVTQTGQALEQNGGLDASQQGEQVAAADDADTVEVTQHGAGAPATITRGQ